MSTGSTNQLAAKLFFSTGSTNQHVLNKSFWATITETPNIETTPIIKIRHRNIPICPTSMKQSPDDFVSPTAHFNPDTII
jgi:hypothetical protein